MADLIAILAQIFVNILTGIASLLADLLGIVVRIGKLIVSKFKKPDS